MNKYQIVFTKGKKYNHAGSKAPDDVTAIADTLGFAHLNIDISYKEASNIFKKILFAFVAVFNFFKLYFKVEKGSVVLCQSPMNGGGCVRSFILRRLKRSKHVSFIFLVHDVELLRFKSAPESSVKEFMVMLEVADKMIVHNERMKRWFVEEREVEEDKLVVLDIFDYLYPYKEKELIFDKSVTIAGNLGVNKAPYLIHLKKLNTLFNLYGPFYSPAIAGDNVIYKGSFPSDELPYLLSKGFGLIWDGTEITTCSGDYGNYLRYNNPHKLSLYLASGLPVFIWAEAAEAEFVKANDVGYCIDGLSDIDKIMETLTEEEYRVKTENCRKISMRLVNGEYTRKALSTALNGLK